MLSSPSISAYYHVMAINSITILIILDLNLIFLQCLQDYDQNNYHNECQINKLQTHNSYTTTGMVKESAELKHEKRMKNNSTPINTRDWVYKKTGIITTICGLMELEEDVINKGKKERNFTRWFWYSQHYRGKNNYSNKKQGNRKSNLPYLYRMRFDRIHPRIMECSVIFE